MNCPKCGTPLENTYRCPKCQHEEPTMKRILRASNYHYNQGLNKTKIRDLSGAIASLQMSLKYNKRNTNARNLLGLVYFQMGETVSALGEWVISVHFQSRNNVAKNYIKKVQNSQAELQIINQTIQNYNLALSYARNGKEDLAINELKKVVSENPNYVRAYQLLALLYMHRKHYSAAKKMLGKALKLDRNNITTVRYMNELMGLSHSKYKDKENHYERTASIQIKDPNPIVIERSANSYTDFNTSTLSFVNILIGIIIGAAVVGLLLVPSIRKTKASEYNQAVVEYSSQISERNKEIATLQNQIDALTDENTQLSSNAENVNQIADNGANESRLLQAVRAYFDSNYVEAGTLLADVDRSGLQESDAQTVYDFVLAKTSETVINRFYAEANEYMNNKDYMNAITYLTKIVNLDSDEVEARYQMGRCYQYLGDFEQARKCYSYIIEQNSDSSYASNAQKYLNELNKSSSQTSETE